MLSATDVPRQAVLRAVRDGEIRPVFQPIVTLHERTLAGFEVLARWDSPVYGAIAPETFIPWAEEDGAIDALTHELVSSACAAAAGWSGQFCLCFNISPLQFSGRDLASTIFSAVDGTGFSRDRLVMEMTESNIVSETCNAHEIIGCLNRAGVRIVLDDFGTGYAGLDRLLSFPFHALKIDRNFVRSIETDADARTTVAAIIGLASSLGLRVVAEGIEQCGQLAVLRSLGCTHGQGWLLGREMTPQEAERFALHHAGAPIWPDPRPAPDSIAPDLDVLFGLANIGLCQIDPQMRLVRANETFAALFRKPAHALNGRTAAEVLPADLADWLATHATRIGASDDTFVFSLPERGERVCRLRIRRMVAGAALAGLLLMAVPN
ncbi:EAL domain-containing protein [Pseudochelatococcus sp. B33]